MNITVAVDIEVADDGVYCGTCQFYQPYGCGIYKCACFGILLGHGKRCLEWIDAAKYRFEEDPELFEKKVQEGYKAAMAKKDSERISAPCPDPLSTDGGKVSVSDVASRKFPSPRYRKAVPK